MKSINRRTKKSKLGHDPILGKIVNLPIGSIRPSPENETLYRPVNAGDPDVQALAASMRAVGVLDPIVITLDNWILSGHRRHVGAGLAGLEFVPCRYENIRRSDPEFLPKLREYNRQRIKSLAELTREEIVSADPEEAYRVLTDHRRKESQIDTTSEIEITGTTHRARITDAKRPFLDAILTILRERREYWPLSVRQIHYVLLNVPPLIHASKSNSFYRNDRASYKAAIDLVARGRLAGLIPWASVDDETRPIVTWDVFDSVAPFIRKELNSFLKGYYRNLLVSQPNQIEVVGEKNTIAGIIRPVCQEFTVPYTIGRGYSSLSPRKAMAERFKKSGKDRLIVLVVSDHDPEGEDIPHSFARSMRDDFGITKITAIKVALTADQVEEMNLTPNNLEQKKNGSRYKDFVRRYGTDGYELEAVPPDNLQRMLETTIETVLDIPAFNYEINAEKQDAAHLDAVRRVVQELLRDVDFG